MGLINIFEEGIENWEAKLQEGEWYFVRLRERITSDMEPHEAFDAISDAVEIVSKQTNEFLCSESFKLLLDLSHIANTRELNPVLKERWDRLCSHVVQFGEQHKQQVSELKWWYGKNSP